MDAKLKTLWEQSLGGVETFALVDPARSIPHRPPASAATTILPSRSILRLGAEATAGDGPAQSETVSEAAPTLPIDYVAAEKPATDDEESYELLSLLGEGGMGRVYRARQSSLRRIVAVKMLAATHLDEAQLAGFAAEARITAGLDHPNIVPVYDLGQDPEGNALLAMKLVEGKPWSALLGEAIEGRALEARLSELIQVCQAVAFAHSRGIVHCDLKPDNIMVGAFGEVLVMDWGLAVDISQKMGRASAIEGSRPASSITHPCGTPRYMAPELALGAGEDIDARTDIYLLGALLHEVLTGRPPHRGERLSEIVSAAIRSAAPALDAALPAELCALCRQALAASPEDRPRSATDFKARLEGYLAHGESRRLCRDAASLLDRANSEHDASLESGARYALLAEAVAGFRQARLLWSENEAALSGERRARRSTAEYAITQGDLALAATHLERVGPRDASEPLWEALDQARQARAARRRQAQGNEILGHARDLALRRRDRALLSAAIERGLEAGERSLELLLTAASIYDDAGWTEAERALLVEGAQRHPPAYRALYALHHLETRADKLGQLRLTAPLKELMARAEARGEENEYTLFTQAHEAQLSDDVARAVELYERIFSEHSARLPWAWYACGHARALLGDGPGAIAAYTEAIALAPNYAQAYSNRAYSHSLLGDHSAALADYEHSLALEPDNALVVQNSANALFRVGSFARAIARYDRALRLKPEGANAPFLIERALAKIATGELKGAKRDLQRAREVAPEKPYAALWLTALTPRSPSTAARVIGPEALRASAWPAPLLHLGHEGVAAELEARCADDPEQRCELSCYRGVLADRNAEPEQARRHYQSCLEAEVFGFLEHQWASLRLRGLVPANWAANAAP